MRVGVLTSHRVPCGIAQYSERLVEALSGLDEFVDPVILAGRADEGRSHPEEWDGAVYDVATIGAWRDDGFYNIDIDRILDLDLDVLHVQYQSMLFNQGQLGDLVRRFPGVTAVTYHDNCQLPSFPHQLFDLSFTHRWNVGPGCPEVIPFGIERRPFVVRTFGLGRTRADLIADICEAHGWVFETEARNEPIHGAVAKWMTHQDLIGWLREADAIVLWYDDNGGAGSSLAVRDAMATRRPVISNNTTWFSDLPAKIGDRYQQVATLEELRAALVDLAVDPPYIHDNSWDHVAQALVDRYKAVRASSRVA